MDEIITNIVRYIDFLKEEHHLDISINDQSGFLAGHWPIIAFCGVHSNPYCAYIKSNRLNLEKCIGAKKYVSQKCKDGAFFGICHAGVEEYIVPIKSNKKLLGFISVSGYRQNEERAKRRLRKIFKAHPGEFAYVLKLYDTELSNQIPDFNDRKSLIAPIVDMLELFYLKQLGSERRPIGGESDADRIYGRIVSYIEQNYHSNINVERLSKTFHCSKSYISHIFKKTGGKSVSEYVNNLRLSEAQNLLLNFGLSIKEIAYMVGFQDSNYFTNTFKKKYGISPKQYRAGDKPQVFEGDSKK